MPRAYEYGGGSALVVEGAACRGLDPALFFPEDGDNVEQIAEAKAVCAGCMARDACLEFALEYPQYGIWGGLTVSERRKLRRSRRRGMVQVDARKGET